jgi:hypothetical protein
MCKTNNASITMIRNGTINDYTRMDDSVLEGHV